MDDKGFTVKIKALTPIWTGGVEGKCDRLHETGIIGSLRWWYEAIIRGLGGSACDPTSDDACKLDQNEFKKSVKSGKTVQEALDEQICPVCQLFGCTGWSRKFKFEMREDNNENIGNIITESLKENKETWMRFIPLRNIYPEEYTLLLRTMKLISKYGSIGGKTIFKPSEILSKNIKLHHQDFGLIKLIKTPNIGTYSIEKVEGFAKQFKFGHKDKGWPNLKYFWFVLEKVLNREQHNNIVNRSNDYPWKYNPNATELQKWLGGKQMDSKKIISFHTTPLGKRTWGYTRNSEELKQVIDMVIKETVWNQNNFKKGEDVLNELFQ